MSLTKVCYKSLLEMLRNSHFLSYLEQISRGLSRSPDKTSSGKVQPLPKPYCPRRFAAVTLNSGGLPPTPREDERSRVHDMKADYTNSGMFQHKILPHQHFVVEMLKMLRL